MVNPDPSNDNTEVKILTAARKVFLERGFDGARMQHIADEAGINKALLHYYYRSKDKLFEAIFRDAFKTFLPAVGEIMKKEMTLRNKISSFIDHYYALLMSNPELPVFILHEIQRNPATLAGMIMNHISPDHILKTLRADMKTYGCRAIDPKQLLVNMISMIAFPFAARPLMQKILFDGNPKSYERFIQKRKNEIKKFTFRALGI
jgi:TetR/AcrR family transcriptional regulator